jgi:hypothetical protein
VQLARQLDIETVAGMLDPEQYDKLRGWLRQPGVGVAVYAGDDGEKHLLTYGNRNARILSHWPPSHYGTWPIYGYLPAGTPVPREANQSLSKLGPQGDGRRWW